RTTDDLLNVSGHDVALTAGGDIAYFGSITASRDFSVTIGGAFDASGIASIGRAWSYTDLSGDLVVQSKSAPIMNFAAPSGNVVLMNGSTFTGTTMNVSGAGGVVVSGGPVTINADLVTTMPVSVSSGLLNLAQPTTLTGIALTNATLGGAGSVTTTGTSFLTNSTINLPFTNWGVISASGANNLSGTAFTLMDGSLTVNAGGTLTKTGGTLDWQGGSIAGSGSLAKAGGAVFAITGGGDRVLNGPSLAIDNYAPTGGSLLVQSGTLSLLDDATHAIALTTGAAGTIDFAGGVHDFGDGALLDGPGTFTRSGGSLVLTGTGSGTTIGAAANVDLDVLAFGGTGKLNNAGTVAGSGGLHIPGDFTNLAGATANLSNVTIDGSLYNHGQFNVGGTVTVAGLVTQQLGGTMLVPGGAVIDMSNPAGVFSWVSGTISGTGTLSFSGGGTFQFAGTGDRVIDGMNFAFNNLTLPNGSLSVQSGSLTLTGTTTIPAGVDLNLTGGTFTNNSTLNVAGGFNLTSGNFTGTGGINMVGGTMAKPAGSTIAWTSTGPLLNTGTLNLADADITNAVDNQGTINVGAGTTFSQPFTNEGSLNLAAGTTQFAAGLTQVTGTTTLGSGPGSPATLNAGGAGFVVNGGTVGGNGTVAGNLTVNGGTLSVGASPGSLTISGDLTLGAASTTRIELGGTVPGTGFDFIDVTGTANLAGTLDVVGFGAFTGAPGNNFAFMRYAGSSGAYGTISLPAGWGLEYHATTGGLLLSIPAPASLPLAGTELAALALPAEVVSPAPPAPPSVAPPEAPAAAPEEKIRPRMCR
ncbi:MAG TPA: hypothetical protein PK375_03805, partial [Rhodocyclaceae bacterium]|nr:hypothetical protein [Rhodocyclaceae bacterium]